MVISHNMMALNAMRQYNMVTDAKHKNTEKLSSGYRINRAADDAAGLAISEKMRRQIRGLTQASANVQDGISFVQVADGALNEVDEMLQRINELAVQATNGTLTDDDREYIDSEVQSLKEEMNRVFSTTSFNERKIWEANSDNKKIIGYEKEQALTVTQKTESFDITDENSGIIPKSSYINVLADSTGLSFSWTGYNGTTYTTDKITWDDYKEKGYSIEAKELFNNPALFAANGDPLINFSYKINPIEEATEADIANTINNSSIYVGHSAPMSARFEDASGNAKNSSIISSVSANINYVTAYDSQTKGTTSPYSFDRGVDEVIEPSSRSGNMTSVPTYTTVDAAKSDTTGFAFSFVMDGIGTVTAKCNSIDYRSGDSSPEAENIWWYKTTSSSGKVYTYTKSYSTTPDLAGIMKMLTDSDKPGLLNEAEGGCSKTGGSATMNFSLNAGGKSVGNMYISLSINSTDTEETVFNKIKDAFNSSTVMDLYTTDDSERNSTGYTRASSARTNKIDVPVYQATNSLIIQAGSEAGQHIQIDYDALSTHVLKINNTKVDTVASASKAIEDVKYAMQIVNEQRSDFGAYQNRMEHTYNNLNNVVENTTAAESLIRDTDMSNAMVHQSQLNILEQAGVSMLAQANQSKQGILSLLQ